MEVHKHDYAQVIIPLKGVMEIEVAGCRPDRLKSSVAGIVPARSEHHFSVSRGSEFVVLDIADSMIRDVFGSSSELMMSSVSPAARQYADLLATTTLSSPASVFTYSEAAAMTALQLLKESSSTEFDAVRPARYLTYAKQRLAEDIFAANPVQSLLTEIGVAPSLFYRQFKEVYGKTPKQVQLEARINYVIERLRSSEDTIADIALRLGYENASSLTLLFKRHLGVPPTFYKNS